LVPEIRPEHLVPGGAGVRAQAVAPDGSLVDDFVIEEAGSTVHVLNAPSPGATASLAIGAHVAGMIATRLGR
jgi:L-2-hydroxyglutarate oxidase LhgO